MTTRETIHTIACQDRSHGRIENYESRYTESEMKEVFTARELANLGQGKVANRGEVRYMDMTVIGQMLLNKSFGD